MCAFIFEYLNFYFCRYNPRGALIAHMDSDFNICHLIAFQRDCKQFHFFFLHEAILSSSPNNNKCYCFLRGVPIHPGWRDISVLLNLHVFWVWKSISLTLDLLLMYLFFHISYLFLLGYLPFACQYLRALHFVKENTWMSKVCYVKHVHMKVSHKLY